MSLTAVLSPHAGYLTAYPCSDEVPLVATVNHGPNELVSGTAFVPVGPEGTICVFMRNPVDVTVDLTGETITGAVVDSETGVDITNLKLPL